MIENKGKFIVFEGIDGSGKSTHISLLAKRLKEKNIKYYTTREPTDGPVGSLIHQFMTGRIKADDKVIAALFAADRLDHLLNETDGIYAKINGGITVISDRYYLSSYAYHGVSMPVEWVIGANSLSRDILKPDCTIFIDITPEIAVERIRKDRHNTELYETYERLADVRKQYLEAIEKTTGTENIIIIDGNADADTVFGRIWEEVSLCLKNKSKS